MATSVTSITTGPKSKEARLQAKKEKARARLKDQVAHLRRTRKEEARREKMLLTNLLRAAEYEALSKETSMYQIRPELRHAADHHQAKLIVRNAELTSRVTVQKGLTVENGTSPTASGTSKTSALQAMIAFSTIAMQMAGS